MAYEFGFDAVRVEIEEVEVEPDEPREFVIEALAGDAAAHISTDLNGLAEVLREIRKAERDPDYRPGPAWEPQLPQMRGFFFHPRIVLSAVQVIPPGDKEDESADFWEFMVDDDDGSQVILRLSETAAQQFAREVERLLLRSVPNLERDLNLGEG